jgi:transcriptional regulator GlxA family with amidase domain
MRHSVSVERKSVAGGACLAAADRYLNECFSAGTPPHVNEFAAACGISPRSLGRIFMTDIGATVARYFKDARLQRARDLLVTTDLSVNAIASAAGFGTRITFFRAFKRATGMSPEQYREQYRSISILPSSLPKM